MSEHDRDYENESIVVHWRPDLCVHCEECFKGLPSVFDPNRRPWVKLENATTDAIVAQVRKCPSGALSYTNKKQIDNYIDLF